MIERLRRGFNGHPGTPIIVWVSMLGFAAGEWAGVAIMLGIYGPLYLYGAWERGKMEEPNDGDHKG